MNEKKRRAAENWSRMRRKAVNGAKTVGRSTCVEEARVEELGEVSDDTCRAKPSPSHSFPKNLSKARAGRATSTKDGDESVVEE